MLAYSTGSFIRGRVGGLVVGGGRNPFISMYSVPSAPTYYKDQIKVKAGLDW